MILVSARRLDWFPVIEGYAFALRRNVITVLMCVELMLNGVNLAFVAFSRAHGTLDGQVLVFFVMVVAAAEAAVGLAIVLALHRHKDTLDLDAFNLMKG